MAATAHTYSFANVNCSLVGPGGIVILGNGAGVSKEGISVEPAEDVATMTAGGDGQIMHSLHAARPGRATVRLLKTSPANAILSALFAAQTASASLYGQNTITVSDVARGDIVACYLSGFTKHAGVTWAEDGNYNEWMFNVGQVSFALGTGNNT